MFTCHGVAAKVGVSIPVFDAVLIDAESIGFESSVAALQAAMPAVPLIVLQSPGATCAEKGVIAVCVNFRSLPFYLDEVWKQLPKLRHFKK